MVLLNMIKITKIIEEKIMKIIGLEGLNSGNIKEYEKTINNIRNKLISLSDDFYNKNRYDEGNEIAYLAYNFPMNIAKVIWIMNLIKKLDLIKQKEIKVLDIGCGEGAGSIGINSVLGDTIKYFKGIDNSFERLNYYDEFMKVTGKNFESVNMNILNLENINIEEFDIIISSNILCEIGPESQRFINKLLRRMNDDAILILIEPALKESSQNLMKIRNDIVRKNLVLPCNHKGECPLLIKNIWCYNVKKWEYPFFIEVINRKLFRDLRLKFSYLIIKKDVEVIKDTFCFLSDTRSEKGRFKNNICTENGIKDCILLKKEISDKNKRFKYIEQGDLGILKNYTEKREELIIINKETDIKIIS